MKKIQYLILSLTIFFAAAFAFVSFSPSLVSAASSSPSEEILKGVDGAGGKSTKNDDLKASIKNITNILMFVVGAVAVLMIVVGGIRYTTSNGDASNVKSAKDTILYSVIGLVVAIVAYAVVQWVVDRF